MANLAYQQAKVGGTPLTFAAASAGGDVVPPAENGILLVNNASAATVTVTVVVPGNTQWGQAQPDIAVAVAAGKVAAIGPLPVGLADRATDSLVHVTYSATASVTVAAVTI